MRNRYYFLKSLKKTLKIVLLSATLISLFFILNKYISYEHTNFENTNLNTLIKQTDSERITGEKLQIEVLNGCGEKGLADLYTNFLRNNGYDVIDYGNADNYNHKKTILKIHNKDHDSFIIEIVDLLAISANQLEYYYNKNIFYDMTLIIGADYKDLSSFNDVSMHYEPF